MMLSTDLDTLKGLIDLVGDVKGATDREVRLFQDDATYSYFCKVGDRSYFASTLLGAIEGAIKGEGL